MDDASLLTLDLIQRELAYYETVAESPASPQDMVSRLGFETAPPFNPCAHLPPDEPTPRCPCPPTEPWGVCQ